MEPPRRANSQKNRRILSRSVSEQLSPDRSLRMPALVVCYRTQRPLQKTINSRTRSGHGLSFSPLRQVPVRCPPRQSGRGLCSGPTPGPNWPPGRSIPSGPPPAGTLPSATIQWNEDIILRGGDQGNAVSRQFRWRADNECQVIEQQSEHSLRGEERHPWPLSLRQLAGHGVKLPQVAVGELGVERAGAIPQVVGDHPTPR
jgi:hypothetical protein